MNDNFAGNLFVSVIVESYEVALEEDAVGIDVEDLVAFYEKWATYDEADSEYIALGTLPELATELSAPLGVASRAEVSMAVARMDVPIYEGERVHCLDVAKGLVRNALGPCERSEEFLRLRDALDVQLVPLFPATRAPNAPPRVSSTGQRKKEDLAARIIQRWWHECLTRRAFQKTLHLMMTS